MKEAYLIFDIGTGNVRVAVVAIDGELMGMVRQDASYHHDVNYPEALYFDPIFLWQQLRKMSSGMLADLDCKIIAITATSQREGIVLVDVEGKAIFGMPNVDHRGKEWQDKINNRDRVYELSGRWPTSLFSALKFVGLQQRRPEIAGRAKWFFSISDWIAFVFTGQPYFEHSQASETLLYDVDKQLWSEELCRIFGIDASLLPPLVASGTILGKIEPAKAKEFCLNAEVLVVVGGADTQLAIRGAQSTTGDVVIVSGTTTPVARISNSYQLNENRLIWTSRHVVPETFMIEANAGVTGLNYQRLKELFYPNESYEVMVDELQLLAESRCIASLGTLMAKEDVPILKGGFIFDVPMSHSLKRADFVYATLLDIACSIKENYDCLVENIPHDRDYVLACGGGFQSTFLRQLVANLIGKKVLIVDTFRQSSTFGGAIICNEALGKEPMARMCVAETLPMFSDIDRERYVHWKKARRSFLNHQCEG